MQLIPSIDVEAARSRLVFWPGSSTGIGTPTDRPERIARHFVDLGAPLVHVVDLDGARAGTPVNLAVVGRIASEVATPLQIAGGIDGPEQIALAFAAGATRVVMPLLAVAEAPDVLRACVDIAGSWMAVGLDPRPERWREYRWRSAVAPTLTGLVDRLIEEGIERLVLSHGGAEPDLALVETLASRPGVEILVAGGVTSRAGLLALRDAGAAGTILGQPLISGQLDFAELVTALADPRPRP
jgi:phosphoribosylformimino-5-aminoimidazole carboxamide ribotide isomerase